MKKKIQLVNKGQKKALCYSALIVLTESQAKKLSCEQLIKQIDNMAIDMAIEWAVEISGNYEVLVISRTTFSPIEEEMLSDLEKTSHEFVQALDKLELPIPDETHEPEDAPCPSHAVDAKGEQKLEFVKELLHDINLQDEDEEHVIGGQILCYGPKDIPFPLRWGKISSDLLREMCELYIAAHENG